MNVLRWCPFVHLFDTPSKIHPTAMNKEKYKAYKKLFESI